MEYEKDEIVSNMVGLYERLRNELGADFRGMDPIDSRRAPIAMLILQFVKSKARFDQHLDSRT